MAGARQKDPNLLVDRKRGRGRGLSVVARPDDFIAPAPPEGLTAYGLAAWERLWRSDISAAIDIDADWDDLEDWIWSIEERQRLRAILRKQRLVEGSHGQLKRNPLAIDLKDLDEKLRYYSDRFGKNPAARFRLQFTVSEAGKSANELLRMLTESSVDMPDVIDLDDL